MWYVHACGGHAHVHVLKAEDCTGILSHQGIITLRQRLSLNGSQPSQPGSLACETQLTHFSLLCNVGVIGPNDCT